MKFHMGACDAFQQAQHHQKLWITAEKQNSDQQNQELSVLYFLAHVLAGTQSTWSEGW